MNAKRLIARLDVKRNKLVKGIHLEGWRFVGDPYQFAKKYYDGGIDEIVYIDSVASLYDSSSIKDVIKKTTENIFVPITVGGGIRNLDDATEILRSGADKVAVNSAAVKNPELISQISNRFGSQCMVLSVQAKFQNNSWFVAYDSAREYTNILVTDWIEKAVELGAGEILLTSVDMEGTQKGFDLNLIDECSKKVNVPIISAGGFGKANDFINAIKHGADAVCLAHSLHYNKVSIEEIKLRAKENKIFVR